MHQFMTKVIFEKDNSGIPASESDRDSALPVTKPYWTETGVQTFGLDGVRATWLGHATVLAEVDGLSVLTDPVFSDRYSASQYLGPKRYRPPACTVGGLPDGLDAVVISHDHYDHLDINSVVQLHERYGNDLHWFVPVSIGKWLQTNVGVADANVHELTWWQEARHPRKPEVSLVLTPSNHWCKRGLLDTNKNLWGSWAVIGPHHRFWFGGDTAYAAEAFRQIGQKLGPFDLAAIPIGAYNPRWFMQWVHVNPEEAVMIHRDLRSQKSVGIHWGTAKLTLEHWLEPRDRLRQAVKESETMARDEFVTVNVGETVEG
jgi:N-acyl-phosphatidylethanolamine-hydrolysing phospholipase D